MKIALGADNAGRPLKDAIKKHVEQMGHETVDFGLSENVCGTGIGMSICANKVKGVRCAHVTDCFSAEATRQHNDANILALGARVTGEGLALKITDIFLSTPYSGAERHTRRISKITAYEDGCAGE